MPKVRSDWAAAMWPEPSSAPAAKTAAINHNISFIDASPRRVLKTMQARHIRTRLSSAPMRRNLTDQHHPDFRQGRPGRGRQATELTLAGERPTGRLQEYHMTLVRKSAPGAALAAGVLAASMASASA